MKKSVFSLFLFFSTERLIVNNIEITDFTRTTDLLGDGSIVFEPESSTLTLNGANITKGVSGKGTLIITGEKKSTLSINGMGNSPA